MKFKPPTRDEMIAQLSRELNDRKAEFVRLRETADEFQQRNQRQAARIKELRRLLDLCVEQYEQICEDNNVMGWPAMVKRCREALERK